LRRYSRDFADSDRGFAAAVGVSFHTPEAFFEVDKDGVGRCRLTVSKLVFNAPMFAALEIRIS
jgi:hypothetical protein